MASVTWLFCDMDSTLRTYHQSKDILVWILNFKITVKPTDRILQWTACSCIYSKHNWKIKIAISLFTAACSLHTMVKCWSTCHSTYTVRHEPVQERLCACVFVLTIFPFLPVCAVHTQPFVLWYDLRDAEPLDTYKIMHISHTGALSVTASLFAPNDTQSTFRASSQCTALSEEVLLPQARTRPGLKRTTR